MPIFNRPIYYAKKNRCDLDVDAIIPDTPDMESPEVILESAIDETDNHPQIQSKRNSNELITQSEKKQKVEEDVVVINYDDQSSPDLFECESFDVKIDGKNMIPQDKVEHTVDQLDAFGGKSNDSNVPFQNDLISKEHATPRNLFSLSGNFESEGINIQAIVDAMQSQTQQTPQIQQQQSENDLRFFQNLSVEESIEEHSIAQERINQLFAATKKSS